MENERPHTCTTWRKVWVLLIDVDTHQRLERLGNARAMFVVVGSQMRTRVIIDRHSLSEHMRHRPCVRTTESRQRSTYFGIEGKHILLSVMLSRKERKLHTYVLFGSIFSGGELPV